MGCVSAIRVVRSFALEDWEQLIAIPVVNLRRHHTPWLKPGSCISPFPRVRLFRTLSVPDAIRRVTRVQPTRKSRSSSPHTGHNVQVELARRALALLASRARDVTHCPGYPLDRNRFLRRAALCLCRRTRPTDLFFLSHAKTDIPATRAVFPPRA